MKSIDEMHAQPQQDQSSIEQTCCDTFHSLSLSKILPNDLAPQTVSAWVAMYFVTSLVLLSKTFREQFVDSSHLVPSFIHFSKGIVQRE